MGGGGRGRPTENHVRTTTTTNNVVHNLYVHSLKEWRKINSFFMNNKVCDKSQAKKRYDFCSFRKLIAQITDIIQLKLIKYVSKFV